jgi:uncharacterized protein YecA (UPF0149 family)
MIDCLGNEVIPLEEVEPEIAEFFRGIANKEKPFGVKSVSIARNGDVYVKTDTVSVEKIGRNDVCPLCNSGKKYKKCCGKNA